MNKTSLYFKEGSSDKEYHVQIEGGTVTFQYGRRGGPLTTGTKCENIDPAKAQKIYEKLISEKIAKGYRPGGDGTDYTVSMIPEDVGYRPQLLNEIDQDTAELLLLSDNWLMQEKEDGRNTGIIFRNGKVIGANKKGTAISIPKPIAVYIESNFVIDMTLCGELVGDVFKAWDIIDSTLVSPTTTYEERYQVLRSIMPRDNDFIKITHTAFTFSEKQELLDEMRRLNAEGVVFKLKKSIYKPGRPNSGGDQLKLKFTATCSVIAGIQNEGKRSVEMWLYDGMNKVNVGNVTVYPDQEIPLKDSVIEVRYLYAYKGGSLFQPVLKGVRDDVDPVECTISQLKYKREIGNELF